MGEKEYYENRYELCIQTLDEEGASELEHIYLGKNLIEGIDEFPEQHHMRLISNNENVSLDVFNFPGRMSDYSILAYVDGEDYDDRSLYVISAECIFGVFMKLLESNEFHVEKTGYLLERTLGRIDHKSQVELEE
jgi:hypothetical protein